MVEEKVVTEWKVREISFHPSIANWQGLVNQLNVFKAQIGSQSTRWSNLVSSTSQRIGVLSSGEPGGREPEKGF